MEKLANYKNYLVHYLREYAQNFNGYILGLSGGLDSAVAALLAKEAVGDNVLCVIINIDSDPRDLNDARAFAKAHALPTIEYDLTADYNALITTLAAKHELNELAKINTKARLRMVTLYALGQSDNKLVLGTDNFAELYTGYFTKHGDGACDLYVLSELTKGEVKDLGVLLNVGEAILSKKPSAGLYKMQTDEDELKLTYADLDNYLRGGKVSKEVLARITYLHNVSRHKREKIARPKSFKRGRK